MTGGWGISGTSIFQSGYPLTAANSMSYQPVCQDTSSTAAPCPSLANPAVGYAAGSGDYNADGSITTSITRMRSAITRSTDNSAWLTGAIPKSNFAVPAFGTERKREVEQFRGPNFAETNINFYKDTRITERVNFQFRFEIFNLFNRANYAERRYVNFPDGNFRRKPRHRTSPDSGSWEARFRSSTATVELTRSRPALHSKRAGFFWRIGTSADRFAMPLQ